MNIEWSSEKNEVLEQSREMTKRFLGAKDENDR